MNRRQLLKGMAAFFASAAVTVQAYAKGGWNRQIALTVSPGTGKAKYKDDRGQREFELELEGISVAAGTVLTVTVNNVSIGTMKVVRVLGKNRASLSLSTKLRQVVPVIVAGSKVKVLNGSAVVATGTF